MWGDDDFSKFHSAAHDARMRNAELYAAPYALIARVDRCFHAGAKRMSNVKPPMMAQLYLRSFYAFRAAAGLALSGQVVETFTVLRSSLEHAGYCLLIGKDPALESVFINRLMSADAKRVQKAAFKVATVNSALRAADRRLAQIFSELYERTIEFGGHPNPQGAFSAMTIDDQGEAPRFATWPLTPDPTSLQHALKSVAQVGVTSMHVLQHVLNERFELLGLREELQALRMTGV